jgi:hypothetical protein
MTARPKFLLCLSALWLFGNPSSLLAARLPSQEEAFTMLREKRFAELEQLSSDLRREKLAFYRERLPPLHQFYTLFQLNRDLDDTVWTNHIAMLDHWVDASPASPTPLVVLGGNYRAYAWKARGGNYLNAVPAENRRLFKERLTQARQALEKAESLPIKDPEVYRELIEVATGLNQPRTEMEAIFTKGIALEPNYTPLYSVKAHYLLPQWKGKPGEWEAFAEASANARGGDEGDMLYMIIARSQSSVFGEDLFNRTKLSYRRIQRGFEASLKRQPDNVRELNSYCRFACLWGDQDQAKGLFKQINGRCETLVWGDESRFQFWQNWATHNAPSPLNSSRSQLAGPATARPGISPGSILLIGGGIIFGVTAVLAIIIWRSAWRYGKSR